MAKSLFEEMDGRLNTYLANIDRQAQERFEMLTEQMKQAQGITAKGGRCLRMDGANE